MKRLAPLRREIAELREQIERKVAVQAIRMVKAATWQDLLDMVDYAVRAEDRDVLGAILADIDDYEKTRRLDPPELEEDHHGFVWWLHLVWEGESSLPETLPRDFLLAWHNRYVNHPAKATPVPIRRCQDCRLILPNSSIDGLSATISACPACGSRRITWMT